MWEFIVSGWLPGTSVRVTFEHCLIAAGIVCTVVILQAILARRRLVRALIQLQSTPAP